MDLHIISDALPDFDEVGIIPGIYGRIRSSYALTIATIAVVILLSGALGAAVAGDLPTYVKSLPPYLNSAGIAVGLISFAWFTVVFPNMIASLSHLFEMGSDAYKEIVRKRAGQLAADNRLMVAFSLPFIALNMLEVWEIWTSPHPPRSLEPWTMSSASQYFAFYYTIVHALLVPFILGSGLGGVLATMWLLYDLFRNSIHLERYRRTEQVISFSTWLLMWALIGFAAVSFLGRATIIDSPGNQVIDVVGFVQSLIAVGIIFIIFGAPMIFARQAINKAKYKELYSLEGISQTLHDLQFQDLEAANKNPEMFKRELTSEVNGVNEWLEITTERIQSVENIPSLPIHVSSLLRVAIGAIIALGSGLLSDWLMINVISPK